MDAVQVKMHPSGVSRNRTLLSEEELEVADMLFELPELILHVKQRRRACFLPDYLRWGVRKSRTLPQDEQNHRQASRQRSPPSRPRKSCGVAAAASPSAPMSFPASVGEDDSNYDDAIVFTAVRRRAPSFKNDKERNEWMEKQFRSIDSLSESNANLHRKIEEYRVLLQGLAADYYKHLESMTQPADTENAVSSGQWRCSELEPKRDPLLALNKIPAEAMEEPSPALAVPLLPAEQHDKESRRREKRRLAMQKRVESWPSRRRSVDH